MASSEVTTQPYADESLKDGITRMRETAKWLIVTFAAVINGFILAGVGLGDLANVDGSRLAVALIAIGFAISAVALGVAVAARVLTAGQVSLTDLRSDGDSAHRGVREELRAKKDLYPGFADLDDIVDELVSATATQVQTHRKLFGGTGDAQDLKQYELANTRVTTLRPLSDRLLLHASFIDVRRRLDVLRPVAAVCFVVVVAAAVAFVLCLDDAKKSEPPSARAERLAPMTIDLSARGERRHRAELGRRCDGNRIEALLLDARSGVIVAMTVPDDGCKLATLELERGDGTVDLRDLPPISVP